MMGKRSGVATTEAEAEALTLRELNQQIVWAQLRVESNLSASLRPSAFRSVIWLEAQRERLHTAAVPIRKF